MTGQNNRIQLHRGDALAVLRDLPTGSVDALITDPPYSSGGMVRGDRTASTRTKYVRSDAKHSIEDFTGDTRDQRAYAYWCALWLGEALRVVKPGGVAIIFTDWRQLPSTTDALQAGGWVWRGIVPWAKINPRPQSGRFAAECEYAVWASNGAMPQDWSGDALPGFYQAIAPRGDGREHQAQKPLEVMRGLVKIAPAGGVVLDLFMGAGTTGVAAVTEHRHFIGVELLEAHFATAERRIRAAIGQPVPAGHQDALDLTEVAP